MNETTSPIDRSALQHGLAQILKCYSAGGLKRFNCSTQVTVPKELLTTSSSQSNDAANIEQLAAIPASVAAMPESQPAPHVHTNAANASVHAATPSVSTPTLNLEVAASATHVLQWQLPNMEDAVRTAKLEALDEQVKACRKCEELVCYRRQTVFGEGHIRPKVCFFGEAPGADEDAQGKPFVGAAGRLLGDIIRAMRMTREEVYILNSLKCRPPQNRTPVPEEVNNCRPFALTQLEILQPEFIILLGAVAVRSVLQTDESVGRLRGRFHHFHGARVVVTYHPAYLLRMPEAKKLVWSDVQMVMRELKLI